MGGSEGAKLEKQERTALSRLGVTGEKQEALVCKGAGGESLPLDGVHLSRWLGKRKGSRGSERLERIIES